MKCEKFILSSWLPTCLTQLEAENTENIPTLLFVKAQVILSFMYKLDRSAMRNARLLLISLALLSSFSIIMGGEALATITIPNMTQTEPPLAYTGFRNASLYSPKPVEQMAMSAKFMPHENPGLADNGYYRMTAFGLNLSPNSQLCPENNCQYGFEDGQLYPNTYTGGYVLEGRLMVSTQQATGTSSEIYQVRGELVRVRAIEQPDRTISFLSGELKIGKGNVLIGGDFDYQILNGSLAFTSGGADLVVLGERNSTASVQQQQSSNMTTLPSQQTSNMTLLQQPVIGQTPTSPLSQLQQLPTTSPTATQTIPQQQQFFPSSPLTSTTGTVQPQASYFPPSSTTFPPAVYPPSGTTFPPTVYPPSGTTYPSTGYPPVGTYPGTGYPMAAAGGMGGVSSPSQIIAPWFPSLPATNCGGTFVMTVEGIPTSNNGNGDDRITPSSEGGDNNGNSDNDDDNRQSSGKSNRRLAVQINSDNGQIITGQQQDAIFGQIFQGQKNIDQNKANDFDIRSIFNDCQISTYSSLG